MALDLARLAAASDFDFLRQLIEQLSSSQHLDVDWELRGRPLGHDIARVFSSNGEVWSKLQNVGSLAMHGGKATVRSVLYRDLDLRDELDELDACDETAAVWLAVTSDEHFQYALSALHADRGLNKRSWCLTSAHAEHSESIF